ncbi:MAG: hypothetical protein JOZ24_01185 [Candidatus Eremiobacteraeota bacterium]|nr:hypothetical protein [Candidatus Eremiobacteraeota bacterium]
MRAPHIDRSLTLHFKGDWGRANLHRALGFLCYELCRLAGPHTKVAIWNGRGAADNIIAVGRGEVDVALTTPSTFTAMAVRGVGPFQGESYPHLRSLGHVPQHDRLVVAVRAEIGVRSFAELRDKKPALRITAGIDDGYSFMGFGAQQLFEASGITRQDVESWGGSFLEREEPRQCTSDMLRGDADAIVQEAVMTAYWKELADKVDLAFLPIEPDAAEMLYRRFGWPTATLPAGYLRGIDREMRFLDFSHFLLIATADLPDDVAYALAWSLIERWETLEAQYRHIPPERSPISYPIDPKAAWRSAVPLHRGAERYYRDAGHLDAERRGNVP